MPPTQAYHTTGGHMINIITVDAIVNNGTVITLQGHDSKTGVIRFVHGDWRAMQTAIEGLGIEPGVEVGVFFDDDDIECLCAAELAAA
jgi:hypothetical protein